jgi:hypothetical protein
VSVSGAGVGGGGGGGGDAADSSDELSVRVGLYEGSPRTYRSRNGLVPKDDDADAFRPRPLATPNSSSAKGFVTCESSVASRWTMSIVPPTRSSVSVLAVCSEDADLPCVISW